jgi:hypothetical protein
MNAFHWWSGAAEPTRKEQAAATAREEKVQEQVVVAAPEELFRDGLTEDPYPAYRRFLDAGPAHFVNFKRGAWAIFSHAGC